MDEPPRSRDEMGTPADAIGTRSSAVEPPPATGEALRAMQSRIADRMFGRQREVRRFGRYVLLEPLGEGGLGSVFAAYDPELDRRVAIKIVRLGAAAPEHHRMRLTREAQALARLSHPNVVQVFDVGALDDEVFVAMELVRGQTLREWLKSASLDYWFRDNGARDAGGRRLLLRRTKTVPLATRRSWREILDVFLQAGRGLAAAHATGLVHRDFKPDNVMIDRDGRARVLDFGLARSVRAPEPEPDDVVRDVESSLAIPLTHTGTVMGTPAYMAPEQHGGRKVDARSDQFAFCVALYESLYGHRPFAGSTRAEIALAMRASEIVRPAGDAKVPTGVLEILVRGLKPEPEARHASMEDLLVALQRFVASPRRRARSRRIIMGAAVVLGLAAWPASAWLREQHAGIPAPPDACGSDALERAALDVAARWSTPSGPAAAREVQARVEALQKVRAEVCALSADLRLHRQACVNQRASELRALVDALTETPSTSAGALAVLPDPQACLDRREHGREVVDATAAATETATWAVARSHADFTAAAERSRAAVRRARTSGDIVAQAEASVRLAQARFDAGEAAPILIADLASAAAIAEDADRPDLAALAWLELARQAEQPQTAAAFLEVARTCVERAGRPRDLARALARLEGSP